MTEAPAGIRPQNAGRDALIAWAVVAALVLVLVQINVKLPAIGHLGSALVAVVFIYTPVAAAWLRREDLDDYGFHAEPIQVCGDDGVHAVLPMWFLGNDPGSPVVREPGPLGPRKLGPIAPTPHQRRRRPCRTGPTRRIASTMAVSRTLPNPSTSSAGSVPRSLRYRLIP